nr:MAG TPA: hypothetical protein [Caudoviricetes sp.]
MFFDRANLFLPSGGVGNGFPAFLYPRTLSVSSSYKINSPKFR